MRFAMTILLVSAFILASGSAVFAEGGEKSADLSLTFNQSSYSNSWKGGESGTLTWAFAGNLITTKPLNPSVEWRNELRASFGQTHIQKENSSGAKNWAAPEKSSDRIFVESIMRFTLEKAADPLIAVTLESQFYDAGDSDISRYFNPILLTEALGLGRTIAKNENTELLTRVGFALRQHISNDVISVDPEKTEYSTTTDGGLEWVSDLSHTFSGDNMKYVTKARVFQALFNSESDELEEDDWKTPDLAWENTLSASFSKYIQVSLFFELLYDKEIDLRGRFRQVLGLGLAYKLF